MGALLPEPRGSLQTVFQNFLAEEQHTGALTHRLCRLLQQGCLFHNSILCMWVGPPDCGESFKKKSWRHAACPGDRALPAPTELPTACGDVRHSLRSDTAHRQQLPQAGNEGSTSSTSKKPADCLPKFSSRED